MTILEKIIRYKQREVAARKNAIPPSLLMQSAHYGREPISMSEALKRNAPAIIAEHKRRSPSKSVINEHTPLHEVVSGYEMAGVAAISVLTDTHFFGGSLDDLLLARENVNLPLLRKEFMIDPYQVHEAKAYGADAILLIAAVLSTSQMEELIGLANDHALEVLLEVHDLEELERSCLDGVSMIGVNNRNLKTFRVSIENSIRLADKIPERYTRVSESGIGQTQAIHTLAEYGYSGFLMGEHFMRNDDPGAAARDFIQKLG